MDTVLEALAITGVGMSLIFLILAILMFVVLGIERVLRVKEPEATPSEQGNLLSMPAGQDVSDHEVIAVISAAVTVALSEQEGRATRRLTAPRTLIPSPWALWGRQRQLESR